MSLKSKGTSKQLFHILDQAKGTWTCYSLSFIDMYGMEAREVIHNMAACLVHHHGTLVYKYFAAASTRNRNSCDLTRKNVGKYYDLGHGVNLDAAPPAAAAHNLVGSVDSMSFMDRHAYAVSNNPRSMDASLNPPTSTSKLFPNATLPPI
jgi:hypothetical protein